MELYDGLNVENNMEDIIERFFKAYYTQGMKFVYTEKVPLEMMLSPVDEDGWFEWQLLPGTLINADYHEIEVKYNIVFPKSFIDWHKRYFFVDGDCSIIRFPSSLPGEPLETIINNLEWFPELLKEGLIPFADEGNDTGPLVFDTRSANGAKDFPIRVYDHEYGGCLDGLSDVIFSSFSKLLECMTYFLNETKTGKRSQSEIVTDFFTIDPLGAGKGKKYWT